MIGPSGSAAVPERIADDLRSDLRLWRVTIMLYNRTTNMLESVAASGVPNVDHRNIRAPVLRRDLLSGGGGAGPPQGLR